MKPTYSVDIEITTTPLTLGDIIEDIATSASNLFILVFGLLLAKVTGTSTDAELDRSVVIYEKNSFFSRRKPVYKEIIPKDIKEQEYWSKLYYLEKAIEKGTLEEILKDLLSGDKQIFNGSSSSSRVSNQAVRR